MAAVFGGRCYEQTNPSCTSATGGAGTTNCWSDGTCDPEHNCMQQEAFEKQSRGMNILLCPEVDEGLKHVRDGPGYIVCAWMCPCKPDCVLLANGWRCFFDIDNATEPPEWTFIETVCFDAGCFPRYAKNTSSAKQVISKATTPTRVPQL